MTVPAAQFVRGGKFLRLEVDFRSCLRKPSRPEAVNEDPETVIPVRLFVYSFNPDLHADCFRKPELPGHGRNSCVTGATVPNPSF